MVALACQLPAVTGVPLAHWTGPELAAELTARNLAASPVSASSVLRILAEHPVKPWQYQSWISPRDPDFAAKAAVITAVTLVAGEVFAFASFAAGQAAARAAVPHAGLHAALGRAGQRVRLVEDRRELPGLDEPGEGEQLLPLLFVRDQPEPLSDEAVDHDRPQDASDGPEHVAG